MFSNLNFSKFNIYFYLYLLKVFPLFQKYFRLLCFSMFLVEIVYISDSSGACVTVNSRLDAGLWSTEPCDLQIGFICQRDVKPQPSPPPPSQLSCPELWIARGDLCYQVFPSLFILIS